MHEAFFKCTICYSCLINTSPEIMFCFRQGELINPVSKVKIPVANDGMIDYYEYQKARIWARQQMQKKIVFYAKMLHIIMFTK